MTMDQELPAYVNGILQNCDFDDGTLVFRRNCNECTRRRRKCMGNRPKCDRCEKNGNDCVYALDRVRTSSKKDKMTSPKRLTTLSSEMPRDMSGVRDVPRDTLINQPIFPQTFAPPPLMFHDALSLGLTHLSQPSPKGEIASILSSHNIAVSSPILPNEAQKRRRSMSGYLYQEDGSNILVPYSQDGEVLTCEDLCMKFMDYHVDWLSPGMFLTPFSYLPPDPLYQDISRSYLSRDLGEISDNPLFVSTMPLTEFKTYLADFYTYLEVALLRLRSQGLDSPVNSVDALKAECILIMFVGLILIKNADTDPSDSMHVTSNFDRILPDLVFRYLRLLGIADPNSLLLSPNQAWSLADAIFLRRLWYIWSSVDLVFAIMRFRTPTAVPRLPSLPLTSADSITHAATISANVLSVFGAQDTDTHILQAPQDLPIDPSMDHPRGPMAELWEVVKPNFIQGFSGAIGMCEVAGQILDWRLHLRDDDSILDLISPLNPQNPLRRYFEDVLDQWRFKDMMTHVWFLGIRLIRGGLEQDSSKVSFGPEPRGLDVVFDAEKSWIHASNLGASAINCLFYFNFWQLIVHPTSHHFDLFRALARKKYEEKAQVSQNLIYQALYRHVSLMIDSVTIWSRLLLLHNQGYQVRKGSRDYLAFTVLENVLATPVLRETTMTIPWMLIELMDLIHSSRSLWGPMEKSHFIVERMEAGSFGKDDFPLKKPCRVGIIFHGQPYFFPPSYNVCDGLTNLMISVLAQLHGDGTLDILQVDKDIQEIHLKLSGVFTVMCQIMEIEGILGYHRSWYALELVLQRLGEPASRTLSLKNICESYMDLPLE